ncbi:hypothetical protein M1247_21895 [Mycobacterium sp. 21AC1]|uniref:hypothetical protein n=1 Tax=[Mycobacterium] appelbergii TaxID=2939269 RepID=UPI00293909EA|nr:hypothetical protein [Mycobacterium sp. 21AC1]MDV3127594.1 hypothetical protein [Mycobacterium sp. 21AC1]
MSIEVTATLPWIQVSKAAGRGVVHQGVHVRHARDLAETLLAGIECWAEHGTTSSMTVDDLTAQVLPDGRVKLIAYHDDGGERYIVFTQAEAVDLALALVEWAEADGR